tara:strand:- start:23 stop:1150 length:1128 start_codon:yes stop_codon:yes gene_type:complete
MMKAGQLIERSPSAIYRAGRLRVKPINTCWAYTLDLWSGVFFPGILGAGLGAVSVAIVENVDGAADFIKENIFAEQVLSSLGTMLVFIVSLRLGANLARNSTTIGHFGNLCGVCVNLAIWSRSLMNATKLEIKMYPDVEGTYKTTEIGLILASIPYVVKYTYRGVPVRLEMLPIGASNTLLARAKRLVSPPNPNNAVAPFLAMVIMLGQIFDDLESSGQMKAPELVLFYNQLNLLTGEEGSIGGVDGYSPPAVLTFLMYLLFVIYFSLLSLGDLAINNSWQSLWIIGVLVVGNLGLFQLSRRYANPFDVSPSRSTQKPIITNAARGTETAIDAIFSRNRLPGGGSVTTLAVVPGGQGGVAPRAPAGISLGLGMGL